MFRKVSKIYAYEFEIIGTMAAYSFKQFLNLGIASDSLLQKVDLTPKWYNDSGDTISVSNYLTILQNALTESDDKSLGLKTGRLKKLSEFGVYGYAVISSRTLGEAADVGFKFWKLSGNLFEIHRRQSGAYDIWELHPKFKIKNIEIWRFLIDDFLASIQTSFSFLANKKNPFHKIHLSYPEPSCHSRYHEFFQCPVYFGNKYNEVWIPKSYRNIQTSMGNSEMLNTCIKECEELLEKLSKKKEVVENIRTLITSSAFKILCLNQVSEKLGMSTRSLQRLLHKRNTTFQTILNETRYEIAIGYLMETDLTVDQISDCIGFSESANFRKAFKNWTGVPPATYRKITKRNHLFLH